MKKASQIIICLCLFLSFIQVATAQDNKNYSTIYFYRSKSFGGSGCSIRVKVGNQDFFNLNNGGAAQYKIFSTGKINIAAI